jgi:sterol 3beta-glucosyltransferase
MLFSRIMLTYCSVKHRDWYIDEGAGSPLIGAVAAVSGTFTSALVSMTKYSNNVSQTVHGITHESPKIQEAKPQAPYWEDLNLEKTRPLQSAIALPPQHLELLALNMAANSLPPSRKLMKRQGKTSSWSPFRTETLKTLPVSKTKTNHHSSKLAEAASETGDLTSSLFIIGAKGIIYSSISA